MNEKYIKKLIQLVEESDIESLEVSHWGRKVKIVHRSGGAANGAGSMTHLVQPVAMPATGSPAPLPAAPTPTAPPPATEDIGNLVEIKSPMVGTFYAAPAPDADPYVSLNEKIAVGQVVCIVEAMKLMNEIEAESGGRVVKILVENAQPVEFGQAMYLIDPNG